MKTTAERVPVSLPMPERSAYYPHTEPITLFAQEAFRRAGDNLDMAFLYGSAAAGDAKPSSRTDMLLIVEDDRRFHTENVHIQPDMYGFPQNASWHTFLNRFGLNYYTTHIADLNEQKKIKLVVISRENFIRGCSGSLREKEIEGTGAFGMYVAGRVMKVSLRPLTGSNTRHTEDIETAINTARIDGAWMALALMDEHFSFDTLIKTYISLSYRADVRIENPKKIDRLFERNRTDYRQMLTPIFNGFVALHLVDRNNGEDFIKNRSLSKQTVEARLRFLKLGTFAANYVKNPLTTGVFRGIWYAAEKIGRAVTG